MAKGSVTNKGMTRRTLLAAGAGLIASGLGATPVQEYRRGGMVYRRLGQTDMYSSLLSFGSHTDPVDRIRSSPPRKNVLSGQGQVRRDRIISRAFDMGVNLLDVYEEEGQWEPAARLVKDRRDKVLISAANENPYLDPERAIRLFGHLDLYRYQIRRFDSQALHDWDKYRKAKEAGKIRALGVAPHSEEVLIRALQELDGLDFVFFPYNFIQARGEYSKFLPLAIEKGIGLIAMKPLASGSIMNLDPNARQGAKPEFEPLQLFESRVRPILPAAVAEMTKALDRMPDETLCMAAMRFVYSQPFLSAAITGMFEERLLEDNYQALQRYQETRSEERVALGAAKNLAKLYGANWLRPAYRWLEKEWGV